MHTYLMYYPIYRDKYVISRDKYYFARTRIAEMMSDVHVKIEIKPFSSSFTTLLWETICHNIRQFVLLSISIMLRMIQYNLDSVILIILEHFRVWIYIELINLSISVISKCCRTFFLFSDKISRLCGRVLEATIYSFKHKK